MKGLIIAGGTGSRLKPLTSVRSKHLLLVYNKPMIYYPVSVLMLAGVREIMIVVTPESLKDYQALLKDGSQWGIQLSYCVQERPKGIVDAMLKAKTWAENSSLWVILGDNFLWGPNLETKFQSIIKKQISSVFAFSVDTPQQFGTVHLSPKGCPQKFVEKETAAVSPWAVAGLYFYASDWQELAESIRPSQRGELEVSDLNQLFLEKSKISVNTLNSDYQWWDMGTPKHLLKTARAVDQLESLQNDYPGYPEKVALAKKWITPAQVEETAYALSGSSYGERLLKLIGI